MQAAARRVGLVKRHGAALRGDVGSGDRIGRALLRHRHRLSHRGNCLVQRPDSSTLLVLLLALALLLLPLALLLLPLALLLLPLALLLPSTLALLLPLLQQCSRCEWQTLSILLLLLRRLGLVLAPVAIVCGRRRLPAIALTRVELLTEQLRVVLVPAQPQMALHPSQGLHGSLLESCAVDEEELGSREGELPVLD